MKGWRWIDGAPAEFIYRVPSIQGCALYNQNTKRVEPAKCSDRTVGSICYLNDSTCSSGILSHVGVGHKGICYVHHCERLTWHEARAHCKLWGHTLALIRDQKVMEVLAQGDWNCNKFWVGLRREEWLDHKDSVVDKIYDHWDPREYSDKGCGRIEKTRTSWIFKPSLCQEKMPFICNTTHVQVTTISSNISATDQPISDHESKKLLIIILIPTGSILLLIVCSTVLVRQISRKRKQRRSRIYGKPASLDSSTLLDSKKGIPKWLQHQVARAILKNFNRIEVWDWQDEAVSVQLDRLYTDLEYAERTYTPLDPEEKHLDVYTDMFSQGGSEVLPYRIYIEGAAGTGKTTLAKRLLVDWARQILAGWWRKTFLIPGHIKKQLGKFDLVLPIFLRNVSEGQYLSEAVIQNLDINTEEGIMKDIIERNQSRILILCEGLDEYRTETAPDITAFLKRGKLKDINLLITSRNNPKLHFKRQESPTTHVILKGFSEKGVEIYTGRFFKGTQDAPTLRKEINKSEDRKELSRYPAVLLLMCVLWRDNKTIADSVTEFYYDFLKYICGRYERKFIKDQDRASPEEIVKKYHHYVMEIGEVAVDGLRGDTLELTFNPSVLRGLDDTTKKLGFFNTKYRETYRQKSHENVSFQHKTFQEFMAAYYIVNCEAERRYELLIHFVSSPNALKEATMLVTFLQGLGKEMITNLVHNIIEGSESDTAKTNTAVHLAFLLDTKKGSFALPKYIELELSQHYTADVLERYFSMDCSAVSKIAMWGPSITNLKFLHSMRNGHIQKVILNKLETGFVDDFDFTMTNQTTQPLRIETLTLHGFWELTSQDITFLLSSASEKSQIIFTCDHSHITLTQNQECRTGHYGIFVQNILVKYNSFEVGLLNPWFQSGYIISARCAYAEHEVYMKLLNRLAEMSSLLDLRFQKCPDISGIPSVLSNNVKLEILHLTESQGSTHAYVRLGSELKHLFQLKEFRICKATISLKNSHKHKNTVASPASKKSIPEQGNFPGADNDQEMLSPVIANLQEATQLEVLDLTDNVVEGDLYRILGDILPRLNNLRELRLGICDHPHATMYVLNGIKRTASLEILDMLKSTSNHMTPDAGKPVLHNIQTSNVSEASHTEVLDLTDTLTARNLYGLLGDILPRLNLRELRLGLCENPHAIMGVCKGLKHTARLEILDMLRSTFSPEAYHELGRKIFSAIKFLKLGKCEALNACKPVLDNIYKSSAVTVLDLSRVLVSADVCQHLAKHVKALNRRELYLCKSETSNAIQPIVNNLEHTHEIEILDISGNISNPEPYEVLDVRGKTTGNKVTSDVYHTLGNRMTSLTKLRELRLCECDEPRGLTPVVRSLHHVTQLQSLDLSGNTADREVFVILGEQLKHLVKLTVLRLCVSDQMNAVRHIVDALYLVPRINILDLSGLKAKFAKRFVFSESYKMSNSVDKTVYQVLGDQLQHLTDLRELRLCNCNDVDAVRPVITELRHTAKLHTLDLLGNEVEYDVFTEIGRQLSRLGELRELRVCYCRDNNAVGMIVEHLHHTPGLVVLDLTGKMVSGEERGVKTANRNTADGGVYETLSRQLQSLPRLRELRVCDCRSDARGEGVAVVDGLQYTPGLQVLQMGRWSLDAAGVEQLGERLVNLREMRQLLLGHCDVYDMGDIQPDASRKYVQIHKAWDNCVSQLSMMSQLQVLQLSYNNIGDDSVVQLSRQLPSLTHLDTLNMFRCGLTDTQVVIQLIDALPSCPSLRTLNVGENHLGDGLKQIVNMTQQLSQLYWLDLSYNKMSESVVVNIKRHLKQVLPDLTLRM